MRRSLERHGQLTPIVAFVEGDQLETLDGLKRLRAARALGWPTVAITIAEVADGTGRGERSHQTQPRVAVAAALGIISSSMLSVARPADDAVLRQPSVVREEHLPVLELVDHDHVEAAAGTHSWHSQSRLRGG
jgi:ParB-like nuclease family protein